MKAHARPRPPARGGFDRWNLDLAPPSATARTGLVSQGQALSARPDRPRRTRPTHCAWILHALRFAGAGTYWPRWTALPRRASQGIARQILVSSPKARRRGRNPSACAIPAPARNQQRTALQDCNRQRLFRTSHLQYRTSTYATPRPGSFESWS